MRDELKKLTAPDYWVYGVRESEFDYTLFLVRKFQGAADEVTKAWISQVRCDDDQAKGEIVSDLAHYNWKDKAFLWTFALWRMQGVLEAIIVSKFLAAAGSKPLIGLKSKLNEMKSRGYQIAPADEEALLAWSVLRNLITHMPPEQYRPVSLEEADILEYKDLAIKLCSEWEVQSKSASLSKP